MFTWGLFARRCGKKQTPASKGSKLFEYIGSEEFTGVYVVVNLYSKTLTLPARCLVDIVTSHLLLLVGE